MKSPSPFLRKIGKYFRVVTKIRENALDKANDFRLVSPELPRSCFTSSNFIGSAKEAALFFFFLLNGSIVF